MTDLLRRVPKAFVLYGKNVTLTTSAFDLDIPQGNSGGLARQSVSNGDDDRG